MDDATRRLLIDSMPRAATEADALAERFYARLFALDPSASGLFARTNMVEQRRKLMDMLDAMLRALDTPEQLVPAAAQLARRHVQYGVTTHHYATVGDALRDAFAETLGARYTPAVHDAWSEAYALLSGLMLRAATAEVPRTR